MCSKRTTRKRKDSNTIFEENLSGKKLDRHEFTLLLKTMLAGDVVVVTKLDRLARQWLTSGMSMS